VETPDVLEALLELCGEAGLEIRSIGLHSQPAGEPPPTSAVCRVRNSVWVVMCAADPPERHIEVLVEALRGHASDMLEERFLPPALRELLQD
jgi:hypothetical protein